MIKQRKPLQRTTPLVSKTGLKRSGSLRRSGPVKARKPGPKPNAQKAAEKLMPKRSGGVCEIGIPRVCIGRASVCSHRLRRSQSNAAVKWSPVNFSHGCLPCEMYLTASGGNAKCQSFGWTVSAKAALMIARSAEANANPAIDPMVFALASIPVFRRGQWVWLTPLGEVVPADLSEIATWLEAV